MRTCQTAKRPAEAPPTIPPTSIAILGVNELPAKRAKWSRPAACQIQHGDPGRSAQIWGCLHGSGFCGRLPFCVKSRLRRGPASITICLDYGTFVLHTSVQGMAMYRNASHNGETMLTPTDGLTRIRGRGMLLSILNKQLLLTRVKVLPGGCFVAETKDWDSYWKPLADLGERKSGTCLAALHSVWHAYVMSGFDAAFRRDLCYRYFRLLDVLSTSFARNGAATAWGRALQCVLGFECFGITGPAPHAEVLGAGTCTVRNPCYLLAKLKMPDAPDDAQFLPVVTVPDTPQAALYYHYRQYRLCPNSTTSLLLFPAVSQNTRSASFGLVNSLIGGVSVAIDPWTRERAKRLSREVVWPTIQAASGHRTTAFVEFVDVGAGSGSLTASLCHEIRKLGAAIGYAPKIRVWFVDLNPADPARFFRRGTSRGLVDTLTFIGHDYRDWLAGEKPLPATGYLRIAMVSKLLNNLSHFCVEPLSPKELSEPPRNSGTPTAVRAYLPSVCLAPAGRGEQDLLISNVRVAARNGTTISQPSLSQYYAGLYLLTSPTRFCDHPEDAIFLPLRIFNPECLVTSDGRSVIARLLENCDYVIIEDADLTSKDLVAHVNRFTIRPGGLLDATGSMGPKGNHTYVLWSQGTQDPRVSRKSP